ncbi:Coagulation factor XIII B chain [Camelus dromedarius]|uniref:Coagulation factor XIII B chain n=1 Tax=Camelus dromedarius TaxID=9838 RepID=A0A5N4CIG6_CAMDR|nr:Coagulation factor XIII B chain [Camelus dromedarius]
MGSKDLAVIILLIISGELYAEEKCPKPDLRNGYIFDTKLSYNVQENMRYGCSSGYKTTAGQDEEVVQCLPDGWSSQPACRKEHEMCLAPELHHGNYSTTQKTFRVKDKVRYECAPGYHTASGKRTEEVECHSYGWALRPRCATKITLLCIFILSFLELKCSSLRLIENGYFHPVKQTYEEGDVVQFFCHKNYYLSGSDLIQCYNFGWYPESPVCEGRRSRCPPPPLPANSNVQTHSATYRHGAAVRLSCELHFEMQGPEEMRCENGKWTEPPKCVGQQHLKSAFPKMKSVEPCTVNVDDMRRSNLEMKWQYEGKILHGDLIDFVCKQGYDLPPPTPLSELSVQCDRGRVKYPLCVRKESERTCASPPLIKNGVIKGSTAGTYENGSSVEYRCFEHYFLQGSREAYCSEGAWTAPPLCLEPCTLSLITMENNNLLLKWNFDDRPYIFHGEYVEFLCKRNTFISDFPSMGSELRVQCDRGQLKYPRCIQRER